MYYDFTKQSLKFDKIDISIISVLIISSSSKKFKRMTMVEELTKIKNQEKITFYKILQRIIKLLVLNQEKLINFILFSFKIDSFSIMYHQFFTELQKNISLLLEILEQFIRKKQFRKLVFKEIKNQIKQFFKNFQIKFGKKIIILLKLYFSKIFIKSCLNQLDLAIFNKLIKLKQFYNWIMFFLLLFILGFNYYFDSVNLQELLLAFLLLKMKYEQKLMNLLNYQLLIKKNEEFFSGQIFELPDDLSIKILMPAFIEKLQNSANLNISYEMFIYSQSKSEKILQATFETSFFYNNGITQKLIKSN